jgi:hypothetical protein
MNYKGSCHCGKVAFDVEGELKQSRRHRSLVSPGQAIRRPLSLRKV